MNRANLADLPLRHWRRLGILAILALLVVAIAFFFLVAKKGQRGFSPAPGTPLAVGKAPYSLATGDINGDGRADLVVANSGSNDVNVLLGDGKGGFHQAAGSPVAAGSAPRSVALGDLNGDGKPDLAVADNGSNSVSVLLGNGQGGFNEAPGSPFAAGKSPYSIAIGYFDGNRSVDLAIADTASNKIAILLGNGKGGFRKAPGPALATGKSPISLIARDLNGDDRVDLAVANHDSNFVSVFLGDGTGGFHKAPGSPFSVGAGSASIAADDFNGDGHLDLALANWGANSASVLLGDGKGGFSKAPGSPFAAGTIPESIAVGDLSGDHRVDLALANLKSDNISILLGDGKGGFAKSADSPVAAGKSPISLVIADFDGNGKPDIAAADYDSNKITILLAK
jgi:hypothetical protein